jgi:N-acetylglucosaminyldiphosphoundecaprenol N-acetyl-beta-D-mannosaminyltransferase
VATESLVLDRFIALEPSAITTQMVGAEAEAEVIERVRIDLGGTLIDRVDRSEAVDRIRGFLASDTPHQIVTVNLDFLSIAERNPRFRTLINSADLAVADGMPLVWLSRLRRTPLAERVAGVELVDESCGLAVETGRGVFLLGAAPGIAHVAGQRLTERHPGLRVVGTYSPPIGPLKRRENDRILRMIRDAAPDFVFVALGAPRQDEWIQAHLDELNVPVAMGVGCVFDLLAGVSRRAPTWMQATGLEWAYRLGREPRRLWRRYIVNDLPVFVRLLVSGLRTGSEPVVVPT